MKGENLLETAGRFWRKNDHLFRVGLVLSKELLDAIYDRKFWTMKLLKKKSSIGPMNYNKQTKKWAEFADFGP